MLFLVSMYSFSQDKVFSLGVQGGVDFSNVHIKNVDDMKAKFGYKFGVVGEYKLPDNFFLQGSLNILSKGAKYKESGEFDINGDGYIDNGSIKMTWNAVYIELPVLAGYKVSVTDNFAIKFLAGPYFSYGVGGKITTKGNYRIGLPNGAFVIAEEKEKDNTFSSSTLKRFDMGVLGAVGAEYQRFSFTLGYEYGLLNISQGSNSIHNMNAFATIGYTIF